MQKVIVVGASSGIGEAVARRFAAAGAEVALVARRARELERVAAEIGARARAYAHDVLDYEATPELFDRIAKDLGGLDVLVYAAGVMPEAAPGEYAFDDDRRVVEVNLLGAMAWMNLGAARFEAARAGTLVGVSSIAGERGRRAHPSYCASKAALTAYLESLRNRLSVHGVNVVTVKPGFVDTAMTRGKKGLFWLVAPARVAERVHALAARGGGRSAFVPARWALVALVVRLLPSFVFRRLDI